MPQFNTGNADWDQGLGSLSNMLFPDVSKIAQAGYYGAMTRNQQIEGDRKAQQNRAIASLPGAIQHVFETSAPQAGPPMTSTYSDPNSSVPGQGPVTQGLAQGMTQGIGHLAQMFSAGIQPGGLGAGTPPPMSSPAPGAGAPAAPTATGSSGGTPPTDPMSAALHPASVMLPGGGGVIGAGPAASNGSPARVFDLTPLMGLFAQAGPEVDQAKIQATLGAIVSRAEQNGMLAKPLGDQILLNFNPGEIGANMRQQYVTDNQQVPVWDNQTNTPTRVTLGEYKANEQRYRGTGETAEAGFNAPTRVYNPRDPLSTIMKPAYQAINDQNVQVTDKFAQEAPGGLAAQPGGASPEQIDKVIGATNIQPPPALTPEQQNQNAQLVDKAVQKLNPARTGKTDINAPIIVDDPEGALTTLTDDIQRTNPRFRYNREGAATEAYKQLDAAGRIVPPNRSSTFMQRNLSGYITGQSGPNPDSVYVDVKDKNGKMGKELRLRLRVLPAGATAPQQGRPGAGILAPQPGVGPVSTALPQRPQAGPVPPTPLRPQAAPGTWRPGDPGSGWNPPRLANPPPPPPRSEPSVPPGGGMMRPSDIAKARGQAAPRGVPVTGAGGPQGSTSSVAAPGAQASSREGEVNVNPQGVLAVMRNGQLVPMTPQQIQQYRAAQQQQGGVAGQ